MNHDSNTMAEEDESVAACHRLAARLADLDLDAETLELVMAALTADDCDHVSPADV